MIKNIIVVDELGNEYEATYPKRAKGLVKNGRARFIGDNKICLVCPPNKKEDINMSNTTKKEKLTIDYVLKQIEQIMKNTDYIHNALEQLSLMPKSEPGDIAGEEKAKAIADVVRCRETTNQQALRLYEKMYDDLKPKEESSKLKAIEKLLDTVKEVNSEEGAEVLSDMLDAIRHMN